MHRNPKELRSLYNVHNYQVVSVLLISCLCANIVKQCNTEKNGNWVCQYCRFTVFALLEVFSLALACR